MNMVYEDNLRIRVSTLLEGIREMCEDCTSGKESEIDRCTNPACPIWQHRMGRRPTREDLIEW